MDVTIWIPHAGNAKTVSAIADPPKTIPKLMPITVKTGMIAFFKACLKITLVSEAPLARAVLTKSWRRTSSMLDLVILMIWAEFTSANVMAGSTKLFTPSNPLDGNQPSFNENSRSA